MNLHDIRFMDHALDFARKGVGLASPNPTVGCIIVRESEIVGQGFHQYEYRDHAEVVALQAAGNKAQGATLYVTLEPCNHTGRTGPCTEAIIAAGVQRVVAAMQDPNPATEGRGFERLRSAGIEVVSGVREEEAQRLNEAFARYIRTKKPFVTLKSGLTLDGQLALKKPSKTPQPNREWVTSEESRAEVHRMRHASDVLLTGVGTIIADDPFLTDRSGLERRRRFRRVVLDSKLRIPLNSRIVKTSDDDLIVFTHVKLDSRKARKLQNAGVEIVRASTWRGRIDLAAVLTELGRREMYSILLEAGPTMNGAALAGNFVDKVALFFAPKFAGAASVPLAHFSSPPSLALHRLRLNQYGPDFCVEGYVRDPYR
ncbi:MAG: bifunctional diaminohydroxyphosphoribosylaminopyrimidine deaminase/5-amino-6-(5-phosphoribosylamino)uracil reductase RibD [Acidobacteria bacterium]|nr:bifunctional diaminohydroxyphosphoribosylaminopyrimidine deaminase/5-amino-6-(5-phosphoribosylamino)uracil reductase RibD [Acidobacteriota bacterium]